MVLILESRQGAPVHNATRRTTAQGKKGLLGSMDVVGFGTALVVQVEGVCKRLDPSSRGGTMPELLSVYY